MRIQAARHSPQWVALSLLLAGAGSPAFAQDGARKIEVSFRDLHRDGPAAILGHFGLPIGRMVRLEGRRAKPSKMSNAATLQVSKVDGRDIPENQAGYSSSIQVDNVDALPEGETIVVEGYEFARWVGDPETNWHIEVAFRITKAVAPAGLRLRNHGAGVPESRRP